MWLVDQTSSNFVAERPIQIQIRTFDIKLKELRINTLVEIDQEPYILCYCPWWVNGEYALHDFSQLMVSVFGCFLKWKTQFVEICVLLLLAFSVSRPWLSILGCWRRSADGSLQGHHQGLASGILWWLPRLLLTDTMGKVGSWEDIIELRVVIDCALSKWIHMNPDLDEPMQPRIVNKQFVEEVLSD